MVGISRCTVPVGVPGMDSREQASRRGGNGVGANRTSRQVDSKRPEADWKVSAITAADRACDANGVTSLNNLQDP